MQMAFQRRWLWHFAFAAVLTLTAVGLSRALQTPVTDAPASLARL